MPWCRFVLPKEKLQLHFTYQSFLHTSVHLNVTWAKKNLSIYQSISLSIYLFIYKWTGDMNSFLQWNAKFSLQKVLGLLSFGSCPNCMSSAKVVGEIRFKLLNERALSNGEPCPCEYFTLFHSFHIKYTLVHVYIIHHIYKHLIQKEKINNWLLQFLKNERKTFLVLQNIFYLLEMKFSVCC